MVMRFENRKVPLYYQLESVLREKITSGKLIEGQRLPTEAELSKEYGVSRITVRQALISLVNEGLIERRQGLGTFVTHQALFKESIPLTGFIEDLIDMGIETSVKVLDVGMIRSSEFEAGQLGITPGSPVLQVKRLRYFRQKPYSYVLIYLLEHLGSSLTVKDFSKGSILQLLEERNLVRLGEAFQVINASLADGYVADVLDINVGAPVLSIERTVHDENGHPIQFVKTLYRSDMYCYTVRLVRRRKQKGNGWTHL